MDSPRWQLLTVSARSEEALKAASGNLLDYLTGRTDVNLADAAYTLHVGRKKFAHARTIVCRTRADAIAALETLDGRYVTTAGCEPTGAGPHAPAPERPRPPCNDAGRRRRRR